MRDPLALGTSANTALLRYMPAVYTVLLIHLFIPNGTTMRLTAFSDYTLRVLVYLGIHKDEIATVGQMKMLALPQQRAA